MRTQRRLNIHLAIAVFTMLLFTTQGIPCWGAEDPARFPSRPISFIIPWEPGGTADLSGRRVADLASKVLGQPVVVENKMGGSGITGVSSVLGATPDGYTIGLTTYSTITILPHLREVPFKVKEDFTWIMQYAQFSNVVAALAKSPWKTWKDFLEDARKNPGKFKYSPPGPMTAQHILLEAIFAKEKVKATFVPVRGGEEANRNLLGGHIDLAASASIWPHIKAGTVRGLMTTQMEERMKAFPDIPTQYELDYKIDSPNFVGLIGPKGIDQQILRKISEGFKKAWEDHSFHEFLATMNMIPTYKDSNSFRELVQKNFESQGKILKELNLLKK